MNEILIEIEKVFQRHKVEYLFIGKGAAILYGYPGTTQDIDIYPRKTRKNSQNLIHALKEIGFDLKEELEEAIIKGKDFIQIRGGPFPLDIVFSPDGIDSYDLALKRSKKIDGRFPCASIEDIIASKKAAKRQRDIEELPRLEAFRREMKKKVK